MTQDERRAVAEQLCGHRCDRCGGDAILSGPVPDPWLRGFRLPARTFGEWTLLCGRCHDAYKQLLIDIIATVGQLESEIQARELLLSLRAMAAAKEPICESSATDDPTA